MNTLLSEPLAAAPSDHDLVAAEPLLSVVIVNYERWRETAALVGQLLADDSFHRDRIEVIVIDNASPPDALEATLGHNPRVRLRRLEQNRGFSAGVNAGFRLSRGRWLLLLNPDLVVSADFLDHVCATALDLEESPAPPIPASAAAAEQAEIGVVGFQLRNRDGTHQPSAGFFPTLGRLLLGLLRPRSHRKYQDLNPDERRPVPWVTGSCLLVRAECLRQLAGFDEEFFLYYEDVDLCLRARARGWGVCYDPGGRAIHLDPLQNRPLTELFRAITRHASLTYFRKHLFGWQFWALAQLVRAEAWLRQRWAEWLGRTEDAAVCHDLRGICRDLMRQRPDEARRRLDELIQRVGVHVEAGSEPAMGMGV